MSDNVGRIFGGCAALAGLWVVIYWWWEPAEPRVRFDAQRTSAVAPESGPTIVEPRPVSSGSPSMAVVPPAFREYTVRQGDTLEGIARRELGAARHADAISRANPYTNLDPLRTGLVIRLPLDPANIQGVPVRPSPTPPAPPPQVEVEEYTVRPGDTLSRIALQHYGSVRYKDLIFQANRDRLRSEDALSVGQSLRLPPKPD